MAQEANWPASIAYARRVRARRPHAALEIVVELGDGGVPSRSDLGIGAIGGCRRRLRGLIDEELFGAHRHHLHERLQTPRSSEAPRRASRTLS